MAYHADSDADDEYERSVVPSPHLPTDSETSHSDSEPPSAEDTPTKYGNSGEDRRAPTTIITEWTAEECADFIASLGLSQYCETFLGEWSRTLETEGAFLSDCWFSRLQKTKLSAKLLSL